MKRTLLTSTFLLTLFTLPACADQAKLSVEQGMGPNPTLPAPTTSLVPTVNIAPATTWTKGKTPKAAEGLAVNAFSTGLDHPRWVYVLPNNDVLVAESDAPPKPEDSDGIKGKVMKFVMKDAGSGRAKSANRISLLRDADGDGVAETKTVFLHDLNSPIGMALVGNDFYVANTDGVIKYHYKPGETQIDAEGTKVADLPAGLINHHWTKNVIASPNGKFLYATVGSNSNVAENGMAAEKDRARILQIDLKTGVTKPFATGLRNPNGMGFEPKTKKLWTAVNERDELGSDLVPDYMTSVTEGAFYGWPYSYYGQNVDTRVKPQDPGMVAKAIKPDYALGPHTASLGLAFAEGKLLPAQYQNGVFIGQHGSWNREPRSGYKVIFVPFANGKPSGPSKDVLTGFLTNDGKAQGRPVEVAIDKKGALLVADDVGNTIWRVIPKK